jgi:hypothetical protein
MFSRFNLGYGLRPRAQCTETTADALGRTVRCQLPSQHVEAHRYLDAYDAVVWGSLDDIATSFAQADLTDAESALRHRSEDRSGRWIDALPTPGKVVWPVIASHFVNRDDDTVDPVEREVSSAQRGAARHARARHRAKDWRRDHRGFHYKGT